MKNTFLLLTVLTIFLACGKTDNISDACISSCSPSTPGKINLAIEDHTAIDITNLMLTINGSMVSFGLLPKREQGSYSCWKAYDTIESITSIQFDIGDGAVYQETVNYRDLPPEKEFTIDIRAEVGGELRIQLVEAPGCVADAN